MTTKELIDAATAAKASDSAADAALVAAEAAKASSAAESATAAKLLHDDLAANGPAVTVSADAPPVVVVYSAFEPDGYKAETIRVA